MRIRRPEQDYAVRYLRTILQNHKGHRYRVMKKYHYAKLTQPSIAKTVAAQPLHSQQWRVQKTLPQIVPPAAETI
jgi:hypothetical protein